MPKLTDARVDWKRKEALWLRTCTSTHRLFCNCTDYTGHLLKIWRGVQNIASAPVTTRMEGDGGDGGLDSDQLIINGGGEGFPTATLASNTSTG